MAWYASHPSQPESRKETIKRAEKFLTLLETKANGSALVISHGFFLMVLAKILVEYGYKGKKPNHFKNGDLIILEKQSQKELVKS